MRWYHHIIAFALSFIVSLGRVISYPTDLGGLIAEIFGGYVGILIMIWIGGKVKTLFKK